jgi:hypothetical protein
MTHPLLEALNVLRQELPRAKTGFVKRFLPQIEEALAAGHSRRLQGVLCIPGQTAEEKEGAIRRRPARALDSGNAATE